MNVTQNKTEQKSFGITPDFPGSEWYKYVYKSISPVLLPELCAMHCALENTSSHICQYSTLVDDICYLGEFGIDAPIIGPQIGNASVYFQDKGMFCGFSPLLFIYKSHDLHVLAVLSKISSRIKDCKLHFH